MMIVPLLLALEVTLAVPVVPAGRVKTAKVETAQLTTANVETVQLTTANVETVEIESADVETSSVARVMPVTEPLTLPVILLQQITLPSIIKGDHRIGLIQQFQKQLALLFRDQRNLQHDRTATIDSASVRKWMRLYASHQDYTLTHAALPSGIRMAAEIHHPIALDVLRKNLTFYKKAGCNAALLTFGYQGEDLSALLAAAAMVRELKMQLFIAYSGPEKLEASVFMDPDMLQQKLATLAVGADGFLVGWRRTSLHLLEQDRPFTDFLLRTARTINPKILVLGEIYHGQTASSDHRTRNLQTLLPENCSGSVVTGFGYEGVAVESVIKALAHHQTGLLPVIVGERPYYATVRKNGRFFVENFQIKKKLADRWIRAGAEGVILLHGDGSDGIYNESHCDNLAQMEVPK